MPINRRRFLETTGRAIAASMLLGRAGIANADKDRASKPNVVLIMADDCGYELFKAYGGESHRTPTIDALAKDGVVFKHCYATPLCTPTRVSIMTGKYNHRNYKTFGRFPKADESETFGNMMKKSGYATCMAGKWQLDGVNIKKMGFDATMRCDSWSGYWATRNIWVNENKLKDNKPAYRPDLVNRFVLDFIETNRDKPFFVYYPMFLIHHPEQPSPDHPDKKLIAQCKDGFSKSMEQQGVFPDMVTYMDKLVGKVVSKLDELGLRENTIILFTGDNGTCSHKAVVDKEIVFGGKGSMRDSGTRVPLIANWEGTARPAVVDDLVDITDFYATLADVAGAKPQPPRDGVSFLPQLRGLRGTPRQWAFVLFDRNDCIKWRQCVKRDVAPPVNLRQGAFWARTERWKLYGDGNLYDLRNDPRERKAIPGDSDTQESGKVRAKLLDVFKKLNISQKDLITFEEYRRNLKNRNTRV